MNPSSLMHINIVEPDEAHSYVERKEKKKGGGGSNVGEG